jgi:hypothetical protein
LWHGQGGTRIREFGGAVHTSASASASGSVGTAVLVGVGVIGDSIGTEDMRSITTAGTTPGAGPFITGILSTEVEESMAEPTISVAE